MSARIPLTGTNVSSADNGGLLSSPSLDQYYGKTFAQIVTLMCSSRLRRIRIGLFLIWSTCRTSAEDLGRAVDLDSRRGLETSRNYLRRKAILSSARLCMSRDPQYLSYC